MFEIDIIKASNLNKPHSPPSCYSDTDISEPDTALTTPTDAFSRRYSYSSSISYKRKPSFPPNEGIEILEQKIQALEQELAEHVKREAELQSQVVLLTNTQDRSTLKKISQRIDQFLVTHNKRETRTQHENWTGSEIPALYEGYTLCIESDDDIITSASSDIPTVLIFRLKSMIEEFTATSPEGKNFCTEIYRILSSWQEFYLQQSASETRSKKNEQARVGRLLEAFQKSLLKNKLIKQDHALLIKKYKADMKHMVNEVAQKSNSTQVDRVKINSQTRQVLESQIKDMENKLQECQNERDEFESTLEMVRREMQTMLEELEDTRQQRLRYKTQASRLRAGLEAIQKKEAKRQRHESDGEESEEEDERNEAIRLLYNEAERQAVDLDRECKRQNLTLNSIRKELKVAEEKYNAIKTEKSKELMSLKRMNQKLTRDVEILQVEKHEFISLHQQMNRDEDDNKEHRAKIYALQVALKAAKSELVLQRTKLSQVEKQSFLTDLDTKFITELRALFQKELDNNQEANLKEMAAIIDMEQKIWKQEHSKAFQKKYDIDQLKMNRELRFLTCKLNDMEDELSVQRARHMEEVSLLRYQSNAESEKRMQQINAEYRLKEQAMQNELEILFQKNQTLQDESMILYGKNMLMAHRLGKIAS